MEDWQKQKKVKIGQVTYRLCPKGSKSWEGDWEGATYDYAIIEDMDEDIETLYIPKEVEGLPVSDIQGIADDYDLFFQYRHYENLKEIIVDPENETYMSIDGCLYYRETLLSGLNPNNNSPYLLFFPNAKECEEFHLPVGAEIGNEAFFRCEHLKRVYMSENTVIHYQAFLGADSIEEIHFPEIVEFDLGLGCMFCGCESLKEIRLPQNGGDDYDICYGTFGNCENLETVYIPDSVEYDESELDYFDSFENCPKMKNIIGRNDTAEKIARRYGYKLVDFDGNVIKPLGKYGRAWQDFMEEHYPIETAELKKKMVFYCVAHDVDDYANEYYLLLESQYIEMDKKQHPDDYQKYLGNIAFEVEGLVMRERVLQLRTGSSLT